MRDARARHTMHTTSSRDARTRHRSLFCGRCFAVVVEVVVAVIVAVVVVVASRGVFHVCVLLFVVCCPVLPVLSVSVLCVRVFCVSCVCFCLCPCLAVEVRVRPRLHLEVWFTLCVSDKLNPSWASCVAWTWSRIVPT